MPRPSPNGITAAALALINRLSLTPHLRARPGFEDEVSGLALDVLRAAWVIG